MSETEQKCTLIRPPEMNDECLKIAAKFRAYRLEAESTNGKLKEAELVINQLKDELNFSRVAEKNLRSQVILAENRLICLQETLRKFLIVSEQQRQNEKVCQNIQHKIEEFREKIDQARQETRNLIECVSSNIELRKKNERLESALALIDKENDSMKLDIQNLIKEKKIMETEFQEKLKNLKDDLEKALKKESETETHYNEMLLHYKGQIEEYEKKVEIYKKERKSLLEDFELPIFSCNNIVKSKSMVTLNAEDRSLKFSNSIKRNKTSEEMDEECGTQTFQCSSFQEKPKRVRFKKAKSTNFSGIPKKQKPQLEFLTVSQESLRTPSSVESGRKRRLFSTNCNHYID